LESNYNENIRSRWWYLVPILFGLVGGIIGYFALRKDDPKKAKNCLILGGILTIINIIVSISLSAILPFDQNFNPVY
tara:strand:+ start:94 stop:324 length:231 start_codon:yes stop_codon:yes gene_type:complete